MTDFDLEQMKRLAGQHNVTVVYLQVDGDYWINQQEFCDAFRNAPLSDHVVIHVRFEGLSLSAAGVVSAVENIMKEKFEDYNKTREFIIHESKNSFLCMKINSVEIVKA